ncbi:MAG TPA: hypothetical protein PL029_01970 [Bacteroidia bacterium]|nr:hypothetical protein [Bacteroidia bacterium]
MKYSALFIILFVFARCADNGANDGANTEELETIASEFNRDGARMIDSETRIDAIEIKGGNTIVYKYTLVNLQVKHVDTTEFKQALKPGIISLIKLSPQMKKLRDRETHFEYYYQDKENKLIYNFKINPLDYQ